MNNLNEDKHQKLKNILNQHIGEIVFIKYYKNPNDEQPSLNYVVVSKVEQWHLICITAFQDTLCTEGIALSTIQCVAKNHLWFKDEENSLYYDIEHDNEDNKHIKHKY